MLVDVHAHLDNELFLDINKILENAKDSNVSAIINCGLNKESNRKTMELSKKFGIIKPALGFYPCYAESKSKENILKEIEWIKKNKPFAIGEIGMDGKEGKNLEVQKEYLLLFLKLAKELDIPAIIHSRKAEAETLKIIKEFGYKKIVMHCFTGNRALFNAASDMDLYFSIPVTVIKSLQFQEMVKDIKLTRILTETDAPFLGPEQGILNEPKNITLSIKKISEIKKINHEECEKIIFMNYQRLFL